MEDEWKSKEDMIAYIWIILGVAAGAFSLFAVPHGFRLLDQQRKASAVSGISIHGDFVSGNKTVIGNQVNVNTSVPTQSDNRSKIDVAKLKIKRAFEDYEQVVETIKKDFPKESEALANKYNVNGVLSSGMHIKAQMELSTSVKEKLEQALTKLNRDIEDVLIENFDKTALGSLGDDFTEEMQRLNKAKSALHEICKALADSAKSWEVKALGEVRLTKDFNL